MEWHLPKTELEIKEVFQLYRKRAERDKFLNTGGELERVWTAFFSRFQRSIKVNLPALIHHHPLLPERSGSSGYGLVELRTILRHSSSTNYVRFLGTVLRSFTVAKSNIKAIMIDCEMALAFTRWSSDNWIQLRLDKLESLRFESVDLWDQSDGYLSRNIDIEKAVRNFFAKRPLTLTHFELERRSYFSALMIPSFGTYGVRNLRSIYLGGVTFNVHSLAQDIFDMPALKEIRLRHCSPEVRLWKPFFEAIHFHAKPMSLEILQCFFKDGLHSIYFPNLDPATFDMDVAKATDLIVEDDLMRYLANLGSWNTRMQERYS